LPPVFLGYFFLPKRNRLGMFFFRRQH